MKRTLQISAFLWLCLPISKLINRINWRLGRPYGCKSISAEPIKKQLQPGMVILTHRNYECSSLFIPGYWTHAAMVVNSEQIIDATRKGVCIHSVESFLSSVDDFIVLKPNFCSQKLMEYAGSLVSNLVGYPFSFDFQNSNKTFYCSGLVCYVYISSIIKKKSVAIPNLLQNYLDGFIIKPEDFYTHNDLWQIIHSYHSFSGQFGPQIRSRLSVN
jgi:hypothetical protein